MHCSIEEYKNRWKRKLAYYWDLFLYSSVYKVYREENISCFKNWRKESKYCLRKSEDRRRRLLKNIMNQERQVIWWKI